MTSALAASERERTREAVTFELGGRTWTCRRKIPFGLVAGIAATGGEGNEDAFSAFSALVVGVVRKKERAEFEALLFGVPEDDDDNESEVVDLGDVMRVIQEVIEKTSGVPFGQSSGSRPMRLSNGGRSPEPAASGDTASLPRRHVKL